MLSVLTVRISQSVRGPSDYDCLWPKGDPQRHCERGGENAAHLSDGKKANEAPRQAKVISPLYVIVAHEPARFHHQWSGQPGDERQTCVELEGVPTVGGGDEPSLADALDLLCHCLLTLPRRDVLYDRVAVHQVETVVVERQPSRVALYSRGLGIRLPDQVEMLLVEIENRDVVRMWMGIEDLPTSGVQLSADVQDPGILIQLEQLP